MSFILDALKKSDQQRQRGATPTLRSVPLAGMETRRPLPVLYGVVALVLLGAGIVIGWLQPWQTEAPLPVAPASAARAADPAGAVAPALPQASAAMPMALTAPAATTPSPTGARKTATVTAPAQDVMALEELPLAIRQELPPMTISLHAYSLKPEDRIVSINNQLLREGGSPAAGVVLEQITPEGMVLSYRGYRFRRGVR